MREAGGGAPISQGVQEWEVTDCSFLNNTDEILTELSEHTINNTITRK